MTEENTTIDVIVKNDNNHRTKAWLMEGQFGRKELIAIDSEEDRYMVLSHDGLSKKELEGSDVYETRIMKYYAPGSRGYELAESHVKHSS